MRHIQLEMFIENVGTTLRLSSKLKTLRIRVRSLDVCRPLERWLCSPIQQFLGREKRRPTTQRAYSALPPSSIAVIKGLELTCCSCHRPIVLLNQASAFGCCYAGKLIPRLHNTTGCRTGCIV